MLLTACRKSIGSHRANSVRNILVSVIRRTIASNDVTDEQNGKSMLYRHLYSKMIVGGAITVADYMREVLTQPNAGYYMKKDVFGAEGDFTTSPEISQLFGEMIAVWTISEWNKISNQRAQLIELGPGRGTLSKDILRVYKKLGISQKISLHLVEVSPALSELQANNLCKDYRDVCNEDDSKSEAPSFYREGKTEDGVEVFWYRSIQDVRAGFSIIIAQEFFDAMPIHKFQKTDNGWREILIDVDPAATDEKFRYVLSRSATPGSKFYISENEQRDHVETSPQSAVIIDYIAQFLFENGGLALIADYGHNGDRTDTFRAFRKHKQQDPLLRPGSADLTADVDFSLLKRIACQDDRLISFGPVTQRHFLKQLGVDARLMMLLRNAPDTRSKEAIISGYRMITDEDKMGCCFKLLALFPAVLKDHLTKWPVAGFQTIDDLEKS